MMLQWLEPLLALRGLSSRALLNQSIPEETEQMAQAWLEAQQIPGLGVWEWHIADAAYGVQAREFLMLWQRAPSDWDASQRLAYLHQHHCWPDDATPLSEETVKPMAEALAALEDLSPWDEQLPVAAEFLQGIELVLRAREAGWLTQAQAQAWVQGFMVYLQRHYPSWQAVLNDVWLMEAWWRQVPMNFDGVTGQQGVALLAEQLAEGVEWQADLALQALQLPMRRDPLGFALAARACEVPLWHARLDHVDELKRHYWPDVEQVLTEDWQIHDRQGCQQMLFWLAGQGHRQAWQLDFEWLQQASSGQIQQWLEDDAFQQGDRRSHPRVAHVLVELRDLPELAVAAWDWVRMIDLALAGWLGGYLSAQEWRVYALKATWLLRCTFDSWEAVANSYLLGRRLWECQESMAPDYVMQRNWEELLLLWSQTESRMDWAALDIDHPDFRLACQDYAELFNARRLSLLGLLASVRDDACLLTTLDPERIPQSRREESADYLYHMLDVQADTPLQPALARFWMPGMVHHFDQLAMNARVGRVPRVPDNIEVADALWQQWRSMQASLAECVSHPAAIVMAEKYAFYLAKALESGHYPLSDLQFLAGALGDYLRWHYPDARTLLAAWCQWDQLTSEGERPLTREIRWQQRDLGSLFHVLDWPRPARRFTEPGRRVSEDELATYNLVGPLTGIHWGFPEPLPAQQARELRHWLGESYWLTGPEDTREFLTYLHDAGDRQEYDINFAPFTLNPDRLAAEVDAQMQGDRDQDQEIFLQRLKMTQANTFGVNDVDLIAWDIAQMVDISMASFQVGWLDEDEMNQWLMQARHLATEHFSGWVDYAQALLAGYSFFLAEPTQRESHLEPFIQRMLGLLLALPVPMGLWQTLSWPGQTRQAKSQPQTSLTGHRVLH